MPASEADAARLAATIGQILEQILEHLEASAPSESEGRDKLQVDVERFCLLLMQLHSIRNLESGVISDMGEYGVYLLQNLMDAADECGLFQAKERLEEQMVGFALWVGARGGTLRELEPITEALGACANRLRDRAELEAMCATMGRILEMVDPAVRVKGEADNMISPWQALNLNRGIVATRSHNTGLMQQTFDCLISNIPEDAPEFFREGIRQMIALDYPEPVRQLMENYYNRFWSRYILH